jgi:hypothetical protein
MLTLVTIRVMFGGAFYVPVSLSVVEQDGALAMVQLSLFLCESCTFTSGAAGGAQRKICMLSVSLAKPI